MPRRDILPSRRPFSALPLPVSWLSRAGRPGRHGEIGARDTIKISGERGKARDRACRSRRRSRLIAIRAEEIDGSQERVDDVSILRDAGPPANSRCATARPIVRCANASATARARRTLGRRATASRRGNERDGGREGEGEGEREREREGEREREREGMHIYLRV